MQARIPAENVWQANLLIESACALLRARPADREGAAEKLLEARSLLTEQGSFTLSWEEEALGWVRQERGADIANDRTVEDIKSTFRDYRERVAEMVAELERISAALPLAVED